ncbi:MAG: sigma-70 family RNA polymerase sigma factor [Candidatus Synoicihabitans palmerolidicus]|nr:sigma-70 family RNA polymerase sigma factor [Candidatus Synoicihabitans palmerolidicus]
MQQTYLKIACSGQVTANVDHWHHWPLTVARHALYDLQRGRRRYFDLLRRKTETDPVVVAHETLQSQASRLDAALECCLRKLPPEIADLLRDKYFRGHSVAELSRNRKISVKAAESRLTRARAQLGEFLQSHFQSTLS